MVGYPYSEHRRRRELSGHIRSLDRQLDDLASEAGATLSKNERDHVVASYLDIDLERLADERAVIDRDLGIVCLRPARVGPRPDGVDSLVASLRAINRSRVPYRPPR